jgi:uncharacterized damage-inducible protein DinB
MFPVEVDSMRSTGLLLRSLLALMVLSAGGEAWAQTPPAPSPGGPLTGTLQRAYANVKRNITEAAEKMPEAEYGFRPVDTVRTYGQFVGHIADGSLAYCKVASGEPVTNAGASEKLTTKAELVAALAKAFAYCDPVYEGTTDAKLVTAIQAGPNTNSVGGMLFGNISHINEHYGNLVTYMRIKGLVPPSTERSQRR